MKTRRYRIKNINTNGDINLTSMIDILFVLLIAFMIPTNFIFGELKLNLPSATAKIITLKKDPIKVYILKDGRINVNNHENVDYENMVAVVDELSLKDKYIKIYVMADKDSKYGQVLNVVGKLNENNFKNVTLITDIHNRI